MTLEADRHGTYYEVLYDLRRSCVFSVLQVHDCIPHVACR